MAVKGDKSVLEVCTIADGLETVREETVVGIVVDISLEHKEATTNNGKISVGHFNYNVRKKKEKIHTHAFSLTGKEQSGTM